jgi:hypothetical protein
MRTFVVTADDISSALPIPETAAKQLVSSTFLVRPASDRSRQGRRRCERA